MKVEDMLNPVSNEEDDEWKSAVTSVPQPSHPHAPLRPIRYPSPKPRGQKVPKDAPVFRKGEPKGVVQFPPHEAGDDEELREQHKLFQVFPLGEIAQYCHHIPYSSDKKTFLSKTGRDAFEVFQYTFKLPDEDREYVVMWDYNVGLVRITPFFKCCKYSKTTPAKVLNGNPGLREISHSITGGALSAQGYWMPFGCAKAVAATFCYNVRYALTPLFGKEFLSLCLAPSDPQYGNFKIEREIIEDSTTETQLWLQRSDARQTPASSREPSEAPGTPRSNFPFLPWGKFKKLKPKLVKKDATPESGYGTDTDWSDTSKFSPQISPKTTWASINRPQTPAPRDCSADEVSAAEGLMTLSSPVRGTTKRQIGIPRSCGDKMGPRAKRPLPELDEEYGGDEMSSSDDRNLVVSSEGEGKKLRSTAARTAHLLLQLKLDGACKGDSHREKRLRTMSI